MLEIDFQLWPPGALWIQIANFLVLLYLLNLILYRPMRKILNERRGEVGSLEEGISGFRGKSELNENRLKENETEARREAFKEKEGLKIQGLEEEKGLLQEAAAAAEKKVESARDDIDRTASEVRKSLEAEVAAFSKDLAEKILGRSV